MVQRCPPYRSLSNIRTKKIPETAIVALGENVTVDAGQIMNVKNLEELKPYFDKDNRYGFYIIEHIDFL